MRVKILLADSAEVRENLLFLLGGAWVHTRPAPQPFAIAGVVEVEWDEANTKHAAEFVIEDEDGNPLMVPSATGDLPFRIATNFEIGRPPGAPRGTVFNVPVALSIPPVPWVAGRRYVLIVRINAEEHDRVRFSVRPAQAVPAPA
ncbi:MAG TPA: hypothetical protein VNN07_05510 [Candidatus Tectomicrobia bacterium]|nr:hypothetical protein [Candidatus Tectomicrobia bacterium]